MVPVRMQAGRKGVQTLQAMRQPVLDQEFQRPIGYRGLPPETFVGQPVQHLIGPHGAMRLKQDFQRAPSHRRQSRTLSRHQFLGGIQRLGLAGMVIMRREGRDG